MASIPPQGPDTTQVTIDAFDLQTSIDVDETVVRILNETRRLLSDLSQQDLTDEARAQAVEDGLGSLSDAPLIKAGRGAASEGFNLGRNAEIQKVPEVATVVRTEVLDENTCVPCLFLDGTVYVVNSKEYFEFMPPNQCDGRELCRGFYLARVA